MEPRKHHHRRSAKIRLIIPLLLTAVAVVGLIADLTGYAGAKLTIDEMYTRICIPLARLIVFLGVGLLVGQFMESMGWTEKLAKWCRPITKWGHLKDESGSAFVASFISGILANTLLMNFHLENKLSRRELTLTYLLNSGLPLYLVHLPTTFFVVSSLAGKAGLLYVALNFAAATLRSTGVLLFSRLTLPERPGLVPSLHIVEDSNAEKPPLVKEIRKKFQPRFVRLVLYTLPIYVLTFLFNEWGFFLWLRQGAAGWISSTVFPFEAAGVVIFALAAEFSSGMAAAGALLDAGTLTVKQTVMALVLGTIVATPIRAVRHQLPTHAGLFSLALGSRLLLMSQVLRVISLVAVMVPYVLWG